MAKALVFYIKLFARKCSETLKKVAKMAGEDLAYFCLIYWFLMAGRALVRWALAGVQL